MKHPNKCLLVFFLFLLCESVFSAVTGGDSLVVSSTESTKEETGNEAKSSQVNPHIYSMHIHTNVSNRFATTLITSKVRNAANKAEETTFAVILPENAFISEFEMEIKGKVYKAYVKEKEEAKQIYQQAVASGQSAAHVELSARDSKTFTVSVNIEPESKTIFRLTYEELLQRQIGQYELVINIRPGQTVEDLAVQVHINESRPLTFVRTPSLRTGNEISKNEDKLDPSAHIDMIHKTSAIVKFDPDVNEQKKLGENLGGQKENGIAGQFVVQYDVERDPQGGEVLVKDGYFVHFFAPSELQPLPKHVVFVLDHSGSMSGRKFEQLVEAMQNILSELKSEDLFNIVRFADESSVWNEPEDKFITVQIKNPQYGNLEPHLRESNLPQGSEATDENIKKAKNIVKGSGDMGGTNMMSGLEVGLFLTKRTQEKFPNKYQPIVIFLTDGFPNVGMYSGEEITKTTTNVNSGTSRAPIFSLSFGYGADKDFLRKLSSHNLGFSRHIYEASDASLQLQDFYKTISSPLLSNIKFSYVDGVSQVTQTHYPILFKGSELVVAGRTGDNPNVLLNVIGRCGTGPKTFNTTITHPVTSLERLWAYVTVKQILKEKETAANATELDKKALDLALKYSFVTPVSSLVVVKPNQTDSVESAVKDPTAEIVGLRTQGRAYASPAMKMSGPLYSNRFYSMPGPPAPQYISTSDDSGIGDSEIATGHSKSILHVPPQPLPQFEPVLPLGPTYTTMRPYHTFPTSTAHPPHTNTTVPQWLQDLKKNNEKIITAHGSFILGQSGDIVSRPECPKTPLNGTGVCTLIFDCPQVFSLLTDINVYLQYFCPLNRYAGVCCPAKDGSSVGH